MVRVVSAEPTFSTGQGGCLIRGRHRSHGGSQEAKEAAGGARSAARVCTQLKWLLVFYLVGHKLVRGANQGMFSDAIWSSLGLITRLSTYHVQNIGYDMF